MPRKKKSDSSATAAVPMVQASSGPPPLDEKAALDFYQRLRRRIRSWQTAPEGKQSRWTEYVLLAPDLFHLIVKLALDPEVTLANRARLAATAAYFMSPFDLIPEMVAGPLGFLDDIALAAYVLHRLINTSDRAIIDRHWAGDTELLAVVQGILDQANAMLGALVADKLRLLATRMGNLRGKV